jgi:hypothetical protein
MRRTVTFSSPLETPEPFLQSNLLSSCGRRPAASVAPTRASLALFSTVSASFSVSNASMLPARPHLQPAPCTTSNCQARAVVIPLACILLLLQPRRKLTEAMHAGEQLAAGCNAQCLHLVAASRVGTAGGDARARASAAATACASWWSSRSEEPPSSSASDGLLPMPFASPDVSSNCSSQMLKPRLAHKQILQVCPTQHIFLS